VILKHGKIIHRIIICAAMAAGWSVRALASTYYVSPFGDDGNSGLDPASPWRSVARVNSTAFDPGSQILFQRGGEWRESLVASSSGTAEQPITYDAYGSGAKPHLWGSDVLDHAAFGPLAGSSSAFSLSSATPINSVLIDHQFTHSAQLLTQTTNAQANIDYVKANANSWFYSSGQLYLNTGGADPISDSRTYTAPVRENVVFSNGKDHLIFRNLIADESAKQDAGYAFRVQGSSDVRIEDSEAYRAGKHHFGVIDSTNFVGKNLYTSIAMPDQGYGGASGYVSFSDARRGDDNSTWINIVADNPNGPYPGFVSHGGGLKTLSIQNLVVHGGAGLFIINENPTGTVNIAGGRIENGPVDIYGSNVTVDGVAITGPDGYIDLEGSGNVIQNNVLSGRETDWYAGSKAAIVDAGTGNMIRFNTVILGPTSGGGGSAVAITNANSTSEIYANAFSDPHAINFFGNASPLQSNNNFFAPDSQFSIIHSDFSVETRTLQQWQAMGYDVDSNLMLLGDANFDGKIDADDFALIDGAFGSQNQSAGYHNGDFNFSLGPPNADDYFIIDREFAAYLEAQSSVTEQASVPEPSALVMLLAAAGLLRRRRNSAPAFGRQYPHL
jgi:hypothetical protein